VKRAAATRKPKQTLPRCKQMWKIRMIRSIGTAAAASGDLRGKGHGR
jgi:hypothetical protein